MSVHCIDEKLTCGVHSSFDCQSEENGSYVTNYPYQYPGVADLTTVGQNDIYLSFICYSPYTGPE